jgi:hypothetical protein
MSRIIDTEIKGPSVRDMATFGNTVFPNCSRVWPGIECLILSSSLLQEINDWCIINIGYSDYYYKKGIWYFTYNDDATLFKLTWT